MTDLEGALARLADAADDVRITGGREYARGGQVFAVQPSSGVVELRLGPDIAEAARRTPDTADSSRGEEWVRFTPKEWDQHAGDRLEAWFRVAWRIAGADR